MLSKLRAQKAPAHQSSLSVNKLFNDIAATQPTSGDAVSGLFIAIIDRETNWAHLWLSFVHVLSFFLFRAVDKHLKN